MKINEMITVLEAARDGKEIEMRGRGTIGGWNPVCFIGAQLQDQFRPNFSNYDYRVKPRPRTWYAYVSDDGRLHSRCDASYQHESVSKFKEIRVREVLE